MLSFELKLTSPHVFDSHIYLSIWLSFYIFIIGKAASSVTADVHGVIAGVPVPFPLSQPDGCKNSGLTCPLKAGTTYSYNNTIPVKRSYPSVSIFIEK